METMTIRVVLEGENGVMCEQTTVWAGMDRAHVLMLEGSYLNWLASLPKTIGTESKKS